MQITAKNHGRIFQGKFFQLLIACYDDGIYTVCTRSDKPVNENRIPTPALNEFMCKITENDGKNEVHQYIKSRAREFKSLNHIDLGNQYITEKKWIS